MTRTVFAAFLLVTASPALPQPVPLEIVELQRAALQDEHAWDITEGLTPEVGPDKIDPEALRQTVAAWTTMIAILSGGIEPEPKRRPRR